MNNNEKTQYKYQQKWQNFNREHTKYNEFYKTKEAKKNKTKIQIYQKGSKLCDYVIQI